MTSLYQLEIIYIWQAECRAIFEFPYYIWSCSLPMARDIWYGVNAVAFTLTAASSLTFGRKRERRRHREH